MQKNKWKQGISRWLGGFGINIFKIYRSLKGFPRLLADYFTFKRMETSETFPVKLDYPCPADFYGEPGIASGHYFHQDLLVARQIFKNKPKVHMDVGSRVDGFVAHVASFREIEVLDIRPASKKVRNIRFRQFDLTKPSSSFLSYCDSLSCLHTLEHMGLGRYGDSLSANGYITGLETLHSILKTGGTLYLSVPIGPQRVEFNAHRVFSVRTILDLIKKDFSLQDFSYVDDYGDIHESVPLLEEAIDTSFDCWYGCGIFQLQKK